METPAEFNGVRPDLEGDEETKKLHELIERTHKIEQLTQHPGWPLYVDYLTSLTVSLQQLILSGRCTDIEDYRRKTGVVEGLRTAIESPKILVDRIVRAQAERDMQTS